MTPSDTVPTPTLAAAVEDPGPVSTRPAILCVDDEPNILSALQRLLHKTGCKILTAPGGEEALAIVQAFASPASPGESSPAEGLHLAMVMSDQRMPRMTGSELLGRVRDLAPDCVRILLTGFADVASAISAVNTGGAFRYMTKPWETQDLLATVQAGLAHYDLIRQNRRLQAETRRQNDELAALNASLEQRVAERTKTLDLRHQELTRLYDMLEKDLFESLAMLLRVMETHSPRLVGHARRVAAHVQRVGPLLGLPEMDVKSVVTAALLHDVGLIGVPHEILDKPEPLLSEPERMLIRRHPGVGADSVGHLSRLKSVALMIQAHHERYDGHGYPNSLKGEQIPLGARVIAVADGYDHITAPYYGEPIPALEAEAIKYLRAERGRAFDPAVVDAFLGAAASSQRQERTVPIAELTEGMVLAGNLVSPQEILLAAKGTVLTAALIGRLQAMPKTTRPTQAVIAVQ